MGRPSKGERKAITLRLPIDLAGRIDQLEPADRHGWIVDGIRNQLDLVEGKTNAPRAEETA